MECGEGRGGDFGLRHGRACDHADHQRQAGDGGECHLPAWSLAGVQPALPQARLWCRGFAAGGSEDEGVEGRGRFAGAVLTQVLDEHVVRILGVSRVGHAGISSASNRRSFCWA